MIVPHVWWLSHRDNHAHAFPLDHAADLTRTYYEAECTHSAPATELTRYKPEDRPPCLACVLIVGSALPDPAIHHTTIPPVSAPRTSAAIP